MTSSTATFKSSKKTKESRADSRRAKGENIPKPSPLSSWLDLSTMTAAASAAEMIGTRHVRVMASPGYPHELSILELDTRLSTTAQGL
jgi:hypothetical protein